MSKQMKFVEVFGSPYERGKAAGKVFKEILNQKIAKYQKKLEDPLLYQQVKKVEARVAQVFPDYLQEVYGRAKGAGINQDLYFLLMCAELINEGVGCTTIIYRKPDGSYLLSHNEDDIYELGNACLTKCYTEKGWFINYDYSNMPFGNAFSWNSSGIVKTINYCFPPEENLDGIPRYFLQRHLSEAVSLEAFVQRCQVPDRASGYHALALDIHSNQAVSVEVTAQDISIKEIGDFYLHTNHYLHEKICQGQVWAGQGSNSVFRLEKAWELLQNKIEENSHYLSREDLRDILEFRGDNYESSILAIEGERNFTCANLSVDTAKRGELSLTFYTTGERMRLIYG